MNKSSIKPYLRRYYWMFLIRIFFGKTVCSEPLWYDILLKQRETLKWTIMWFERKLLFISLKAYFVTQRFTYTQEKLRTFTASSQARLWKITNFMQIPTQIFFNLTLLLLKMFNSSDFWLHFSFVSEILLLLNEIEIFSPPFSGIPF